MRFVRLAALAVFAIGTTVGCSSETSTADESPDAVESSVPLGYSVENMDRTADPRQDFYRYAAGGWLDRVEIPATRQQVGGFSFLSDVIDRQLLTLIRDAAADPGTSGSRQKIGDFYTAAMDLERIDELGVAPIEPALARAAEATTPAARAEFAAWQQLNQGSSPLIGAAIGPDLLQSDVNVLYIAPGSLGLNRNEYLDEGAQTLRDLYAQYAATLFGLAGDAPEVASERARTVLEIETALAEARLTPLEAADPRNTYNRMSVGELQSLLPSLDVGVLLTELGLDAPETLIVQQPRAMEAMEEILSTRPAADLATLLRWSVLRGAAELLSTPYREAGRDFSRRRQGIAESPSRQEDVTMQMRVLLPHALSRLYVEEYFPESTRTEVLDMVERIRDEFRRRLESNPWLSDATRAEGLEKLSSLQVDVGYPEEWIDYSGLEIAPDDYLGNVQRALAFSGRRNLSNLGQPVVRDRYSIPTKTTPVDVNAGYMAQYNAIEITAAVLQPPFYDPTLDAASNYCTIGAVIGHEFTHAYDKRGRLFDAEGNLRDWWTPADVAEFERRMGLLIDQFNGYEAMPGLVQDGALTVGENTADLGGINFAYDALQRHMAEEGRLEDVDGLTPEQRCFVSWAQLWMSKARPEKIREDAATNPHALSPFRTVGPLVNLDAFYTAFDIQPEDAMWRAPEARARIW